LLHISQVDDDDARPECRHASEMANVEHQQVRDRVDVADGDQASAMDFPIDPPTKEEFDKFWEAQHGVRGLFVMDEVTELPAPVAFKV